jgi:hypothetical protein
MESRRRGVLDHPLSRVMTTTRVVTTGRMTCPLRTAHGRIKPRPCAACIQALADLLLLDGAESFQQCAREIAMAKGQMRSNKEKKKPKADKNLKKGGAAPVNPFATGKTPAGQSPNSKKN